MSAVPGPISLRQSSQSLFQSIVNIICYFPKRIVYSSTPRRLLFTSNSLIILMSIGVTAFSVFIMILLFDKKDSNLYIDWIGLGIVGIAFIIVCSIGIRGADLVSLDLLLTYFWGITVFLAPLALGTVGSLDFYSYVDTWFQHSWDQPNFEKLRGLFCATREKDKCGSPYKGGVNYNSIDEWCLAVFNATDCHESRLEAINLAIEWGKGISLIQAGICVFDFIVVVFSMYICYDLITPSILTQSMNDVINYLLIIPVAGCAFLTYYLWWLSSTTLSYAWLSKLYLAITVTQVIVIPLGVFAGRIKSRPLLITYLVLIVLIIGMVGVAGFICFTLAGIIRTDYKLTDGDANRIACEKQLNGCCCCNDLTVLQTDRCPAWSTPEIVDIVVRDVKLVGSGSLICCIYLVGAFVVAIVSYRSLQNYKTDYV